MPMLAISTSTTMLLLLGGAVLILYIAGRFSIGAMPAVLDRAGPRAIVAIIPVLAISLIAVFMSRPMIGLHLPIACATAALTFGIAAVLTGRDAPADSRGNRTWALLIPAIAMLLIAAMGDRLDLAVLVALVSYTALALHCWQDDPVEPVVHGADEPSPTLSVRIAALLWFTGIAAACVAGVLAIHGTGHLDSVRGRPSDALVAVFLLTPAIVLPFFFELLPPCRSIGWTGSMSSLVKFALMCIGCVLPLVALAYAFEPRLRPYIHSLQASRSATQPATLPVHAVQISESLVFPNLPTIATRLDLIVLIGVSLLLVPAGAGWLRPGKLEALALLGCYMLYLLLVMASSL